MSWRGLVRWMLPWPSKAERLEAIEQARWQKERSLAELEHAQGVQREIERETRPNHYAHLLARQIAEGRRGRDG